MIPSRNLENELHGKTHIVHKKNEIIERSCGGGVDGAELLRHGGEEVDLLPLHPPLSEIEILESHSNRSCASIFTSSTDFSRRRQVTSRSLHFGFVRGCTKRWTPGSVNMKRKNCVLLPAAARRAQLFHLLFTEPGVHLLVHPCKLDRLRDWLHANIPSARAYRISIECKLDFEYEKTRTTATVHVRLEKRINMKPLQE